MGKIFMGWYTEYGRVFFCSMKPRVGDGKKGFWNKEKPLKRLPVIFSSDSPIPDQKNIVNHEFLRVRPQFFWVRTQRFVAGCITNVANFHGWIMVKVLDHRGEFPRPRLAAMQRELLELLEAKYRWKLGEHPLEISGMSNLYIYIYIYVYIYI